MAPSATAICHYHQCSINLEKIESEMHSQQRQQCLQEEKDYVISNIMVSTEPAELLQSDGEPNFTPHTANQPALCKELRQRHFYGC